MGQFLCMYGGSEPFLPDRWGKYAVTPEQFPMGHMLPDFCNGPCSSMSLSASKALFQTALTTDNLAFPLEDVLFTGIFRSVAKMSNIKHVVNAKVCHHITKASVQQLTN